MTASNEPVEPPTSKPVEPPTSKPVESPPSEPVAPRPSEPVAPPPSGSIAPPPSGPAASLPSEPVAPPLYERLSFEISIASLIIGTLGLLISILGLFRSPPTPFVVIINPTPPPPTVGFPSTFTPRAVETSAGLPTFTPRAVETSAGLLSPTSNETQPPVMCQLPNVLLDIAPYKPMYFLLRGEASMVALQVVNIPDDCTSMIVCLEGPPGVDFYFLVCQEDKLLGRGSLSSYVIIPHPSNLMHYYIIVRAIRGSGDAVLTVKVEPVPIVVPDTMTKTPTPVWTPTNTGWSEPIATPTKSPTPTKTPRLTPTNTLRPRRTSTYTP
jgi:hypothetical protein